MIEVEVPIVAARHRRSAREFRMAAIVVTAALLLLHVPCLSANSGPRISSPSPARVEKHHAATDTSSTAQATSGSVNAAQPRQGAPPGGETLAAEKPAQSIIDGRQVIAYLGELISWYRHFEVEERLATQPAETLYVADDRENAKRALQLGFQYADAAAKLLNHQTTAAGATPAATATTVATSGAPAAGGTNGEAKNLLGLRIDAKTAAAAARAQVKQIETSLNHAGRTERDSLRRQLATARAELSLAQSRVDSLNALIDFEHASGIGPPASALAGQIAQLEAAVAPAAAAAKGAQFSLAENKPAAAPAAPSGMVGLAEQLFALRQKQQTLADTVNLTQQLAARTEQLRRPLIDALGQVNREVMSLAANSAANDLAAVKRTQTRVEELSERHRLVVAALLPLSKQAVTLDQYVTNLGRWRATVNQRFASALRSLLVRVGGLVILLLAVVVAAALWRRLTFRYVRDLQRRYQLLRLSRVAVVVVIALVLLFDFANQLGALATVMGFAAAGIALTLQNVIMSMAGYFYLSGRYGIRVGDRVQISNINGDVVEIGLFKMTLLELSSDQSGFQPTGRVVVFPNSVVFQPNSNFSKQLPGTDFTWNELRLSLAPDCDYRLAERRLVEVVNAVFMRYRETIQREYRGLERELNLPVEAPRPQSRLRLSDSGVELMIRYPAQLKSAVQTSDEIARRLVDAIKREPALKLATLGTPLIQLEPTAPSAALSNDGEQPQPAPPLVDQKSAGIAAAAAAGATLAEALVESAVAEEKREGVESSPASPKS